MAGWSDRGYANSHRSIPSTLPNQQKKPGISRALLRSMLADQKLARTPTLTTSLVSLLTRTPPSTDHIGVKL